MVRPNDLVEVTVEVEIEVETEVGVPSRKLCKKPSLMGSRCVTIVE